MTHPTDASMRWKMIAAFAAVYLIWGSTYLFIRFAIETLPPFVMAGARFLIAGGILYGWLVWRGEQHPQRQHWRSAAIVGGLLMLGGNGMVTWAEQRVPSGLTALIVGATPIWVAILSWLVFGGARPNGAMATGLIIGMAGIALLIGPASLLGGEHLDPVGTVAVLFAAICWATGSLYSRRATLPSNPAMGTALEMLTGGVLLWLVALPAGDWGRLDLAHVSLKSALSFGYLAVFGSLVAFTAYIWLLRNTTPSRATSYAYVNPVVAVFLGWALADEALSARTLLAAAVIIASVMLITSYRAQDKTIVRPAPKRITSEMHEVEAGAGK